MTYILSVCSRKENTPKSLAHLDSWVAQDSEFKLKIAYNAPSILEGHRKNFEGADFGDCCIMCHDDIRVLSNHQSVKHYLDLCYKSTTGFVGVAGAYTFDNGAWWTARQKGTARGFCFQGKDPTTMTPNYFGAHGQVVVLDGLFLAITSKKLPLFFEEAGKYSDWDYYDIASTIGAHLKGYNNYTVPILVMHESDGVMRKSWYDAKDKYLKEMKKYLPIIMRFNNGQSS